jgi:tRNA(Ile2) C34 agmatinyltransferase TiaS
MANENTRIHGPASIAPIVSNKVAICAVCKTQWQVRGDSDKMRCSFCGADEKAISIKNEEY